MTYSMKRLQTYRALRGLYARVARQLHLDASYVSRVADGQRSCERISLAIEAELSKAQTSSRKIARRSRKRAPLSASRHYLGADVRRRS